MYDDSGDIQVYPDADTTVVTTLDRIRTKFGSIFRSGDRDKSTVFRCRESKLLLLFPAQWQLHIGSNFRIDNN